ncbi:hypothetical protein [Streptomyces sp. NPDC001205]
MDTWPRRGHTTQAVTGLQDRPDLASQEVFDLTVDGLHTFYVRPQGLQPRDVLVHNCTQVIADENIEGAHTLRDHVPPRQADGAEGPNRTPLGCRGSGL